MTRTPEEEGMLERAIAGAKIEIGYAGRVDAEGLATRIATAALTAAGAFEMRTNIESWEVLYQRAQEREAILSSRVARLEGTLRQARTELIGIGPGSTMMFHRLGIESAISILDAGLSHAEER